LPISGTSGSASSAARAIRAPAPRACAALPGRCRKQAGNLAVFGAVGVPIFFVISGLVIGLQRFETGAAGIYDFMAKRLARIAPLYWVMTLAYVCWASQLW
ncbi:hypothetical protein EN834_35840, partial [bacterium M00.F.Ca.ET.191.01.1.1]